MIWIWQAIRLLFIPAIPKVNNLRTRENEDFDVIDPAEVGNDGGVTESGDNITDSLKVIIFRNSILKWHVNLRYSERRPQKFGPSEGLRS